jgi:hypothetical protein
LKERGRGESEREGVGQRAGHQAGHQAGRHI